MMKTLSVLVALAGVARAQEPPPPPPQPVVVVVTEPAPPIGGVGVKAGVLLPQIATELGAAPTGGLELSLHLPFAARRVAIFAEVGYAQPKVSRSGVADPRFPAAVYDGTQTQRELVAGGGFLVRVAPPRSLWNGYAQLGARAYFLETITVGSAGGQAFGENREQSAKLGGLFALGVERRLGPGVVLLEAGFGTSDLPHLVTGDVSTGAIEIQLGYRFLF